MPAPKLTLTHWLIIIIASLGFDKAMQKSVWFLIEVLGFLPLGK